METELLMMIFRIASVSIGVELEKIRRIIPAKEMAEIQHVSGHKENFVVLDDGSIPLWDFRKTFCVEPSFEKGPVFLIVLGKASSLLAFFVDDVDKTCSLPLTDLYPAPVISQGEGSFFGHIANLNGKLVWVLDTERLFLQF